MADPSIQEAPLLAINIGNDIIQVSLSSSEESLVEWHISTPNAMTSDEAIIALNGFFRTQERERAVPDFSAPSGAIVASVVPSLTDAWTQAAHKICGRRPLVVGPGLKTGLRMNYDDPAEIGADRIADLIAAYTLFDGAFVIVDLGTTTNFAVVDAKGVFRGGIIAPGFKLSTEALVKGAARLHAVDLKPPSKVIGTNTRDALRSGIILGEVARIDGMIEKIWEELGYETEVLAAGPGISEIACLSKHINHIEENLTMRGLRILYTKNRDGKK